MLIDFSSNRKHANRFYWIGTAFKNAKEVAEQGSFDNDATFDSMAGDIIQLALSVLGVLFVVFMIYAGYLWLTAAGNEQKVAKQKG